MFCALFFFSEEIFYSISTVPMFSFSFDLHPSLVFRFAIGAITRTRLFLAALDFPIVTEDRTLADDEESEHCELKTDI